MTTTDKSPAAVAGAPGANRMDLRLAAKIDGQSPAHKRDVSDADTIIATMRKNSREELRVSLGEFKGHKLCQLRTWVFRDEAESLPTKSGFGIQASLIPSLREALADAEAEARRRGWIGEAGSAHV